MPNAPITASEHWSSPLTGHGLAYFRELVVAYKTLQWVNPHSALAATANKEAEEKKAAAAIVATAFSNTPSDPAQRTAYEAAKALAEEACKKAAEAAAKEAVAAAAKDAACELINQLIEKSTKNELVWRDILEFESALLRLQAGEELRARYASMAIEYEGLTENAAPVAPKDEDALRAVAETLLTDIHWAYTTAPVQERQRAQMVVALGYITLLVILMAVPFVLWSPCPALGWIAIAGALGASLSAFQRAQSRNLKGDALTNCEKGSTGSGLARIWNTTCAHASFAMAPIVGAVCAMVLAHIYAAGLISGPAFPQIVASTNTLSVLTNTVAAARVANAPSSNPPSPSTIKTNPPDASTSQPLTQLKAATVVQEPARDAGPVIRVEVCGRLWQFKDSAQLALMLVWGFIAGFSERLVPDIISRLTERTKASS